MAEEHRLTGHTGSVLCLRMYQGRTLFSGSTDGSLKARNSGSCALFSSPQLTVQLLKLLWAKLPDLNPVAL